MIPLIAQSWQGWITLDELKSQIASVPAHWNEKHGSTSRFIDDPDAISSNITLAFKMSIDASKPQNIQTKANAAINAIDLFMS
jgi:hypothetical protein